VGSSPSIQTNLRGVDREVPASQAEDADSNSAHRSNSQFFAQLVQLERAQACEACDTSSSLVLSTNYLLP
jgi:hypothetical protein